MIKEILSPVLLLLVLSGCPTPTVKIHTPGDSIMEYPSVGIRYYHSATPSVRHQSTI